LHDIQGGFHVSSIKKQEQEESASRFFLAPLLPVIISYETGNTSVDSRLRGNDMPEGKPVSSVIPAQAGIHLAFISRN
jgi:hypothetical protein